MLRNNELRELARQMNKSSRTSLLSDEERKAVSQPKEIKKPEKVANKKNK